MDLFWKFIAEWHDIDLHICIIWKDKLTYYNQRKNVKTWNGVKDFVLHYFSKKKWAKNNIHVHVCLQMLYKALHLEAHIISFRKLLCVHFMIKYPVVESSWCFKTELICNIQCHVLLHVNIYLLPVHQILPFLFSTFTK